jgi:tRNA(Ile)-lysidine synthase
MPADLLKSLLSFNHEKGLFQKNEKIGLAVSGGLDSVVLLHLFYQLLDEWNLQLIVLHFDHHLRDESRMDAEFVQNMCLEKNITFECGEEAVAHYADQRKLSIEMAARDCRYSFFQQMIQKHQLDKMVTAHTANDQAETILHHIMRGTGVDGLRGIPAQRDQFIRPLLFVQRDDLHLYAIENNLTWREDHSNQDESFTRNRIRHTLLPIMHKQFNPQIVTALNRLSDSAREHEEIIQNAGRQAFENCVALDDENEFVLEIDCFFAYLKSLQRLVLQQVFKALGHDPAEITYNKMEGLYAFLKKRQSGESFSIIDGCELVLSGGFAVFRAEQKSYHTALPQRPGSFELWENLFLEILACAEPLTFEKNKQTEFIDADKLGDQLVVRSPKPADFFYPINGVGRKKLSDFFVDEKVAFHKRLGVPVLESDGKIVWLCGYRLDDRFKVTDKTKRIYKLMIGSRGRQNSI